MEATAASIDSVAFVTVVSAEMLVAIEESRGLTPPGLVFTVPVVMLTAKKKAPELKPASPKAKRMAKMVAAPSKGKKCLFPHRAKGSRHLCSHSACAIYSKSKVGGL